MIIDRDAMAFECLRRNREGLTAGVFAVMLLFDEPSVLPPPLV